MDISATSCMEFSVSNLWGLRCTQEFHDQYLTEKAIEEEIGKPPE